MVKDLTHGNTAKTLIRFTIPMLISVCFQQLYNIADSIIAGKFLGGDAIAGAPWSTEYRARVTSCPGFSRTEVFPRMWDLQC